MNFNMISNEMKSCSVTYIDSQDTIEQSSFDSSGGIQRQNASLADIPLCAYSSLPFSLNRFIQSYNENGKI